MAKTKQKQQSSNQKENLNGNQKVNKNKLNKIKPEKGAGKIKKQKKKKVIEAVKEDVVIIPSTRKSDDAIPNKVSYHFQQRENQCNTVCENVVKMSGNLRK